MSSETVIAKAEMGPKRRGAVSTPNPDVAWNGSLEIRKQEAREIPQPQLRLVE